MILHSKLSYVRFKKKLLTEILKITDLCTFYVGQLKELGLNILGYRSEKLKNRLIKHFDDTIYFLHPRYRSESVVVFSNEVPKGQIVEAGLLSTEKKIVQYFL